MSICGIAGWTAVPFDARRGTVCCRRLDGDMLTCRALVPIQTRSDSSFAFSHSRYHRPTLLVNPRSSASAADKVYQMSGGLRLQAATHRVLTSGKHLFELEHSL